MKEKKGVERRKNVDQFDNGDVPEITTLEIAKGSWI